MHVSVCAEICDGFPWMTVQSGLAHSAGRTAKGQRQVPDLSCRCVHAGSLSRPRKAHLQLGLCRVAPGRYPHSWQPYHLYKRIEALTSEICIPAPPGACVPPASWVNSPSILGLNPRRPPGGRCPHSWAPKWAAGRGGKSVQDLGTGISASHPWARGPPRPKSGSPSHRHPGGGAAPQSGTGTSVSGSSILGLSRAPNSTKLFSQSPKCLGAWSSLLTAPEVGLGPLTGGMIPSATRPPSASQCHSSLLGKGPQCPSHPHTWNLRVPKNWGLG